MKMKEFNAGSRRGIANAVMELEKDGAIDDVELEKDGAIDDLVLDLRGNPGGVLEGAFQVSGIFMEEGKDASRKTLVVVRV
ncbi:hypothetical protein T484DRAFT_1820365 [Baffinella frigidus]|nr:hypothetical protein T484DRAFT_1820365 [Cryptophyta sp. CCMP2293]